MRVTAASPYIRCCRQFLVLLHRDRITVSKKMRLMEGKGGQTSKWGALSCAASSWRHFDPLHKWNLSPSPPTPQYYSIHVYKPCPSFWWHTYSDISFWLASPSWLTLRLTGRRVWLHFYSTISFILPLPLLFSVRHTHPHNIFMKIEAWKTTCNSLSQILWHKIFFPFLDLLLSSLTECIYWFTVMPRVPPSSSSDSVSLSFLVYNLCSPDYGPSQFIFFMWWMTDDSLTFSSLTSPSVFPRYLKHQLFWLTPVTSSVVKSSVITVHSSSLFCIQYYRSISTFSIWRKKKKKRFQYLFIYFFSNTDYWLLFFFFLIL